MRIPTTSYKRIAAVALATALLSGCPSGEKKDDIVVEPFYPDPSTGTTANSEWQLVFSDEFNGDALASTWSFQEGDGSEYGLQGWGNNELQWYQRENATFSDGKLVITAEADSSAPLGYTSSRLRSIDQLDLTYGRVEASIKAPAGQGLWSAFWMLPTDEKYGGWASSGEVDIMEVTNAGTDAERVFQTLHFGFPWPLNRQTGIDIEDIAPADDFNTYAIEWDGQKIRWYINDVHYMTIRKEHFYSYYYANEVDGYQIGEDAAPFDVDFHLILNLAVGGNLPGAPDGSWDTAQMEVDYVRVYKCNAGGSVGEGCNSNANRTAESAKQDKFYYPAQTPYQVSYTLFDDMPMGFTYTSSEGEQYQGLEYAVLYSSDGSAMVTETADSERGTVLEYSAAALGNFGLFPSTPEPTADVPNPEQPRLKFKDIQMAGEIKLDMYIDSAATDAAGTIGIKMDSGWPALGQVTWDIADLPMDTWFTRSIKISDMVANPGDQPLDLTKVLNLFIVEPSGAAHLKVDNVQLVCGHVGRGANGCGYVPPVEQADGLVEVFGDSLGGFFSNPGFGAWDDGVQTDYFQGNSLNHVKWSVVPAADVTRGNIVQVNFGTNGANGVFYMKGTGADLSNLETGNLVFDIRLEAGSTHGITWKVDCASIFTCTTGDQQLDLSGMTRGEWTTITIPVSAIKAAGADLTQIAAGLVIFPTWGDQQGVSFDLDNIRYEIPEGQEPPAEPTLAGIWKLEAAAGALAVGPSAGDLSWWGNSIADVTTRACLFDDEYVFNLDGSFENRLGADTWLEGWQGATPEGCGTPVAPFDGSASATYTEDATAGTITIDGTGAFLGLAKANNSGEISNGAAVADSITYAYSFEGPTTLVVQVNFGGGVWQFRFTKAETFEQPSVTASPVAGRWQLAPVAGALAVGPSATDLSWWGNSDADVVTRSCLFDDEYVFYNDGSFENVLGADTWLETWQGVATEGCGAPVSPFDGQSSFTYTYDATAKTVTLNGAGAFLGLAKANNQGEISNGAAVADNITYSVDITDASNMTVMVNFGGGVWAFKLVKVGDVPPPVAPVESPVVGSWSLAAQSAALAVGPSATDLSWWSNSDADVVTRACLFDDEYVFNADGSFENVMGTETWLETWQGVAVEGCGPPASPFDGQGAFTYSYDANAGTVTLNGAGAFLGLAKANNQGEISNGAAVADSITYTLTMADANTMTAMVNFGGGVWAFTFTKN